MLQLLLGLGGVVLDIGDVVIVVVVVVVVVVKSERGQVEKVSSFSKGGVEGADEDDMVVVVVVVVVVIGSVNIKGEGGGWDCNWANIVVAVASEPGVEDVVVVVEPHEFLLPFLFLWACNFNPPDLLAALIAAWLLGIWLWVVLTLEVEVAEEW